MSGESKNIVKVDVKNQSMNISEEMEKQIQGVLKKCAKYWKEKNYTSLIEFAKSKLEDFPKEAKGEGHKGLSGIYFLLGSSILEAGGKAEAKEYAIKAAHFDRPGKNPMWLVREINSDLSENSGYMKCQAEGEIIFTDSGKDIPQKFKTIYSVVAESEEEAFEYIYEIERPEARHSLKIVKSNLIEKKPVLPKGLYENMRLITQPDDM